MCLGAVIPLLISVAFDFRRRSAQGVDDEAIPGQAVRDVEDPADLPAWAPQFCQPSTQTTSTIAQKDVFATGVKNHEAFIPR